MADDDGEIDIEDLPYVAGVMDGDGVLVAVNEPWRSFEWGSAVDEEPGVGTNYLEAFGEDAPADTRERITEIAGGGRVRISMNRAFHTDDEFRWFRLHVERTARGRLLLIHQAITEELWKTATVANQSAPMLELDLDGVLVDATDAWLELVGRSVADELGDRWLAHVEHADRQAVLRAIDESLRTADRVTVEARVDAEDGEQRHLRLALSRNTVEGEPVGVVVNAQDITDDVQVRSSLQARAGRDELTGLAGRGVLREHLDVALAAAQRTGHATVVLFCDLDGFKAVNDEHGHAAGDRILVAVAERLEDATRPSDVVARLGGDEFVVLFGAVEDTAAVADVVERVREAVGAVVGLGDGLEVSVGVSVGVAIAHGGDRTADELLEDADRAMYDDKRAIDLREPADTGATDGRTGS